MTLRHYGRALAALSGAALLCATLSVPAFATPTSDTDAAAPTVVAATDEESAPITVTATRTDSHGDKVYEGDLITVTLHLHQQHRQRAHRLPGGLEPVRRPHHRRSELPLA